MLKKPVMPHLKVKFLFLQLSDIRMISDLGSTCINFVLIEASKLEQKNS